MEGGFWSRGEGGLYGAGINLIDNVFGYNKSGYEKVMKEDQSKHTITVQGEFNTDEHLSIVEWSCFYLKVKL